MSLASEVDEKLKIYRSLQTDIQALYGQKQQALSQFNENTLVKGELDLLVADEAVFKLVGPVLMSLELDEAKENVQKRLEFIQKEIERLEALIGGKQKEQTDLGDVIVSIQQRMQAEAASAAREIADGVTAN